ncbi:MAG: SRPBCC domain-containing protein [Candidatus Eremiobacteraeota bacterium]|nr:SRPBCC domain-containing protein [Candidatus Eremiobacteraeota bacterium]
MRVSQWVAASVERVYAAFVDPEQLLAWLPPEGMTGRMHRFDEQGYEMSLYYGTRVRVELREPPFRLVETAVFESADPAFQGEMRMTTTLEAVDGGTLVTLVHENLPPGVSEEDDEEGARSSLGQLARFVEGAG